MNKLQKIRKYLTNRETCSCDGCEFQLEDECPSINNALCSREVDEVMTKIEEIMKEESNRS